MTQRRNWRVGAAEVLERLDSDLVALTEIAGTHEPSLTAWRRIDSGLRALATRAETLRKELDPTRHPNLMFDPGNPAVVGRFIALATIAQPRVRLDAVERFYGSGVYSLYYNGGFAAYESISKSETPIYVGKADPQSETAKTPLDQGVRLFNRLKDHVRSIGKVEDTLDITDFECRFLVVQTGWQGAAENYLIGLFRPIWNSEVGICYGVGKHGDAPSTRGNLRSPWDTLHPGRDWAWRDPSMGDARSRDQILGDMAAHFSDRATYRNVDEILKSVIDELRQL